MGGAFRAVTCCCAWRWQRDQTTAQLIAAVAFGLVECLVSNLNQYFKLLSRLWNHGGATNRDRHEFVELLAANGIAPLQGLSDFATNGDCSMVVGIRQDDGKLVAT